MQQVAAVEGREDLRITFPKLNGYRVELPDEEIWLDLDVRPELRDRTEHRAALGRDAGRRRYGERESRRATREYRPKEVAFALAKRILDTQFNTVDDKRPWLFPKLAQMCQEWIEQRVSAGRWLQPRPT